MTDADFTEAVTKKNQQSIEGLYDQIFPQSNAKNSVHAVNSEDRILEEHEMLYDGSSRKHRRVVSTMEEDQLKNEITLTPGDEAKPMTGHNKLAKIIGDALAEQFETEKMKQLDSVTAATPTFCTGQFLESIINHILNMIILGPLSIPIMLCFTNMHYLRNSAFIPTKDNVMFFIIQTMIWAMTAGAAVLLVLDHLEMRENEDSIRVAFDSWPFVLAVFASFSRIIVLSFRAGCTSSVEWADVKDRALSAAELKSRLMLWSWITLPPERALAEVQLAMVKCGVQDRYFQYLTMNPVFPTMKQKLRDPEYWNEFGWTFPKSMKQEKEKIAACESVLYQFKDKRQYNIDECKKQMKKVPLDFDESFNYLKLLNLRDDNFDLDTRYSGQLWMRELYMKGQTNIFQKPTVIWMMTLLLASASYMIASAVLDETGEDWSDTERFTERTWKWRVYNVLCLLVTFIMNSANAEFIWNAFWDANRRITIMKWISAALEINFIDKDATTIRMPTVNFMDRQSLLTWLEARKVALEVGARFQRRVQLYMTYFIGLLVLMLVFAFCVFSGFFSVYILSVEQWASFTLWSLILLVLVMMVLLPNSYLNEEMMWQIKRMTRLREIYQRLVRDPQLLKDNPVRIQNRIQQLGVKMLRRQTADLTGEERFEKMRELAGETYDSMSEAIDEVEKDITYSPREFLGVPLYPDSIWGYLSLIATTAFALFQSSLSKGLS